MLPGPRQTGVRNVGGVGTFAEKHVDVGTFPKRPRKVPARENGGEHRNVPAFALLTRTWALLHLRARTWALFHLRGRGQGKVPTPSV